jgi:hypothetical protein
MHDSQEKWHSITCELEILPMHHLNTHLMYTICVLAAYGHQFLWGRDTKIWGKCKYTHLITTVIICSIPAVDFPISKECELWCAAWSTILKATESKSKSLTIHKDNMLSFMNQYRTQQLHKHMIQAQASFVNHQNNIHVGLIHHTQEFGNPPGGVEPSYKQRWPLSQWDK